MDVIKRQAKTTRITILILLGLLLCTLEACTVASDVKAEIDQVMTEFVKLDHFSGVVLVAKEGEILYAQAFGEANKDHHVKNTLSTKFELGSVSKIFTGIGVMQLVERGLIRLDDPVKKHLPKFPFGKSISIIHLLTHTSGLPEYKRHPRFAASWNRIRKIDHLIPLIYEQKLKHEKPGEIFDYSSSAFILLGHIIEKKTGLSYAKFIRKNILEPAGMTDTSIANLENVVENRATGYRKNSIGKFNTNAYVLLPFIASAGIQSTCMDMLKFDEALTKGILLKQKTLENMYKPYIQKNWGIVWRLSEVNNSTIAFHGGEWEGVSAMYRRYLKEKITLIILSNFHRAGRPVAQVIESILFGLDYVMPKATLAEFLYQRMKKTGVAATVKDFDRLLEDFSYKVKSRNDLIGLGTDLLRDGQFDTAVEIFKLNTRLFPSDAVVYDYLGYAFELKGDRESAIKNYEKALEINPKLSTARESLKELKEKK